MTAATGAALGLCFALGVVLALAGAGGLRTRVPGLEARVVPYLPDGGGAVQRARPMVGRGDSFGAWLAAALVRGAAVLDRLLGGRASVRWRLDVLGDARSVEEFRRDQAMGGAVGCLAGLVTGGLVSVATGSVAYFTGLVLAVTGLVLGVLAPDWRISSAVRRRDEAIAAELPVVAELLALAIAAGEGVAGALERVAVTGRGVLAVEFGRALAEVRAGGRLTDALRGVGARTRVVAVGRLMDVLLAAMARGTPLAEVMRAQAADVMSARRQAVLEEAGRRSIAMLVPVVFLVLPVTVLFAVFPGLVSIVQLAR